MSRESLPGLLLAFGGSIFVLFGTLHGVFTLGDIRTPRRFAPEDPSVIAAMSGTGMRLARGGTTMWRAWIGFNLSHSVGAILFGAMDMALGWRLEAFSPPPALLLIPVLVGLIYLGIGLRYWFRVPTTGIAVATGSFAAAWLLY